MKVLEFETLPRADNLLPVPDEIASQLPQGQKVRVLVLIEDGNDEEREWVRMAAQEFARGYADEDAIYDDLPPG